ncbi:lysozyme [Sulfitobacter sp. W074]|uniref:lysozyme n=1 Tax=Sulfitobacter sp. W074 TaxID=2867026 RepID=UPI0021A47E79|nr:lysozyme [Sulfitobacter sp. W074]UWR36135.1 lysozyme [Sulfitobacter sp. W074]
MKISDSGILEIAEHEGIVLGPYRDSVGVWTVGVGHTAAAGGLNPAQMQRGMPADVSAAVLVLLGLFDEDLDKYEARVNSAIKVPLKQHQFDALVSFDFNTGGIYRAKLTEAINRGDMRGDGFMGWLKPKEIIRRRKAEQALFRTGDYDANGDNIPIWRVDESGNLRGILKTISGAEMRRLMASAGSSRPTSTAPPATETPASPWWASIIAAISRIWKGK